MFVYLKKSLSNYLKLDILTIGYSVFRYLGYILSVDHGVKYN